MMEEKIKQVLSTVVHPETGKDIVASGFIEHTAAADGKVTVVLRFAKTRDPFALKIKKQAEELLQEAFPGSEVLVVIKEGGAAPRPEPKLKTTTGGIAKVIAVASGKGGVGKSTVTANLAVALRNRGFRVGILDADIYGPSQPKMFGLEGYLPEAEQVDGQDIILPAEAMDMKIMSIGFFIKPTDALLWRGAMAVSALKQMIHQTRWGTLDFLLADLPPGTGDVHLSIIGELKIDAAVIVSTPQQVAVADVVRGVEMFRKLLDEGEAGDNVGLLLRGIDKKEVKRGMVVAKPGSITPHTEFEAEVYILKKEEGGRHTPFHNNYRPQFYLRTMDVTGEVHLPAGVDMVMPGDHVTITVKLIYPVALNEGLRFAIREGGRTVGAGQILKVVK